MDRQGKRSRTSPLASILDIFHAPDLVVIMLAVGLQVFHHHASSLILHAPKRWHPATVLEMVCAKSLCVLKSTDTE